MASLLVQQLLTQFSTAFLANNGSSTAAAASTANIGGGGGGGGRESGDQHLSLKEFLCQDSPLLLMLAIQLVGQKVHLLEYIIIIAIMTYIHIHTPYASVHNLLKLRQTIFPIKYSVHILEETILFFHVCVQIAHTCLLF